MGHELPISFQLCRERVVKSTDSRGRQPALIEQKKWLKATHLPPYMGNYFIQILSTLKETQYTWHRSHLQYLGVHKTIFMRRFNYKLLKHLNSSGFERWKLILLQGFKNFTDVRSRVMWDRGFPSCCSVLNGYFSQGHYWPSEDWRSEMLFFVSSH